MFISPFSQSYIPSKQDILFARKATKGIVEHDFVIKKIPFKMVDVGGQRSQRQKWFQCFDGITSILFMVSSSEYDQVPSERISDHVTLMLRFLRRTVWSFFSWLFSNCQVDEKRQRDTTFEIHTKLSLWSALETRLFLQSWQRFKSTVIWWRLNS